MDRDTLIKTVQQYSFCSPPTLVSLYNIATSIKAANISGDIVECGVYNGGSAALLAAVFADTDKRIWLYDSFKGMPPAVAYNDGQEAEKYTGQCVGSLDKVREVFAKVKVAADKAVIMEGWFKDTFKHPLRPDKVAILHIDCDWYASVLCSLHKFYCMVEPGGAIILDDFGHWEGCRKAFYSFNDTWHINPLIERSGYAQLYWYKGRENNRFMLEKKK